MGKPYYKEMPYDRCNVEYVMDSLSNFDPDILVTVWFNGKQYYIEEVDTFGNLPELIIGKEVK